MTPLKLLWHSNAAFVGSGYGQQTQLFTQLLTAAGHQVIVSAFHGIRGAEITANGIRHLPNGFDPWGNDLLPLHYDELQPDVTLTLMDTWVLDSAVLARVPVTAWTPVDHDPIPPRVAEKLKQVAQPWAMSRFGEREMRRLGLTPEYVPHGVDTTAFRPLDRAEARQQLGVGEQTFFAVAVAANKGWPSRKSLDRLLKAWARFCERHPDSRLYLHTLPGDQTGGLDLVAAAQFYGIDATTLRFPDVYRMLRGNYGPTELSLLYNAADVLALPSAGGGFEIPLIEAQACGTPVVTTAVTAMAELVGPGYGIAVDPFDGLAYTQQGSEQANVLPSQILAGLEWAFERKGDLKLRAEAREFALEYDAQHVLDAYLLPALERQVEAQRATAAERAARTAAREALRSARLSTGDSQITVPEGERFEAMDAL